jgi:hypothetical protein
MSYDILIVKENKEGEPVGEFSTQLILAALQEHPNVRKDKYGLWEYNHEGMGFAISFDEDGLPPSSVPTSIRGYNLQPSVL